MLRYASHDSRMEATVREMTCTKGCMSIELLSGLLSRWRSGGYTTQLSTVRMSMGYKWHRCEGNERLTTG